jgi:hypothetical protein
MRMNRAAAVLLESQDHTENTRPARRARRNNDEPTTAQGQLFARSTVGSLD